MPSLDRRHVVRVAACTFAVGTAGCSIGSDPQDPADRGPLSVDDFAFAAGEPEGYGSYERQPDETYAPGSRVWVYAALDGLAARPIEDGDVRIDLEQHVSIDAPGVEGWVDETERFQTELGREHLDRFYTKTPIGLPSDAPTGEYDLEIEFEDHVSNTRAAVGETFVVAD